MPLDLKTTARSVVLALAFWFVALPASAFTISLTVSGTTYNVLFTQGSFDAVNGNPATPLTTTPWFGNLALATDLATALRDANIGGGGPVVPDAGGWYNFLRDDSGSAAFSIHYAGPTNASVPGSVASLAVFQTSASFAGDLIYYASVAPPAVPEIDGNAMAKALFILFTLYVWLQVRRNRRAMG